jgi:GDPmannose 4,6-dehydratase
MKTAFITGCTGQDGSYLAELLLHKGYTVHGLMRRSSTFNTARIDHIFDRLHMHYGDVCDGSNMVNLLEKIRPDEVYHLAAMSHVRVSFDIPVYTAEATALGTCRLLDAIHELGLTCRFYQAGSSEMFGGLFGAEILDEQSRFHPRSPYGCAKVYSHWATVNWRESYGMHASNGILFNHESPRRGETFVTRKITRWLANHLKSGKDSTQPLYLGNLDAKRDWGYAPDYVCAMWRMLQQPEPGDYVIATGETHSVKEFLEEAFAFAKLDWKQHVKFDQKYVRPAEVNTLIGDARRAAIKFKWYPRVRFKELVKIMVQADMNGFEPGLTETWDWA